MIENISPGRYAIATFHDENDNGKLDRDAVGIPTKGYGFSNGARGSFGPPKFGEAVIQFGPENPAIGVVFGY